MDRNQKFTLILSLINDERKSKRTLSAKACTTMKDYCPGMASDWGICSVGATDKCTSFDWSGCKESATDICKYDYAGCAEHVYDLCETDYKSDCIIRDTCIIDTD